LQSCSVNWALNYCPNFRIYTGIFFGCPFSLCLPPLPPLVLRGVGGIATHPARALQITALVHFTIVLGFGCPQKSPQRFLLFYLRALLLLGSPFPPCLRGACLALFYGRWFVVGYCLTNTFKVIPDFVVGKSNHRKSVTFKHLRAFCIIELLGSFCVVLTVKLNDQFEFGNIEVSNKPVNGALFPGSVLKLAKKFIPEFPLRRSHVLA
jgi:hypothetical protein